LGWGERGECLKMVRDGYIQQEMTGYVDF